MQYDYKSDCARFFNNCDLNQNETNIRFKTLSQHDKRGKWTRDELIEKDIVTLSTIGDHKKEIIKDADFAPPYREYGQWKDHGYYSNQFDSKLQKSPHDKFLSLTDINRNDREFNEDVTNLELKTIDIEKDIMDDFTIVLVGRRRSGKTFLMRWLLYHLRHRCRSGIVITGTKTNNFWSAHVPEEYIHDVTNINEVIDAFFERQTLIEANPQWGIDPRAFLILDDILSDTMLIRYSKALQRAFTDGRHLKVMTLVTTQDPHGIPPILRENTDCAIIFRQFTEGRKESVCSNFVSFIDNKKSRKDFLWNKTGRWDAENNQPFIHSEKTTDEEKNKTIPQALIVLMADLSENVYDIFKRATAEKVPEFILGDADYWKAMSTDRWNDLFDFYGRLKDSKL
jgi:hypothetical protein